MGEMSRDRALPPMRFGVGMDETGKFVMAPLLGDEWLDPQIVGKGGEELESMIQDMLDGQQVIIEPGRRFVRVRRGNIAVIADENQERRGIRFTNGGTTTVTVYTREFGPVAGTQVHPGQAVTFDAELYAYQGPILPRLCWLGMCMTITGKAYLMVEEW